MFEKSLVDLIRGMRGHKGREAEYMQAAIKECRTEIRSQDMDVKATALLKLIYLEMFGYDMTWAAFNVLEVMSAANQMQKRIGYLAAVQSFSPDTEVLMLAENLLKKDLASPAIPTLSLPLATLPHIVTSSLALSILTDLLPRLSHSRPGVRKKTITSLYRLALVYPETLRVAWPKLKERLLDDAEDGSVTAATVNVVCELGWRRPQDFLPLAPRLFELLVDSGNNWMAIKIIKLFAILTPLEPRLVKKLVRPLTNLIQTTSAMSLLYECINGIIQGGILDGSDNGVNVEDVADLCITKLRGMIVLEGDPNLKYVALLAFNRIVTTHPSLVALQQDVILRCLDDPDISIRLQALDLTSGMVNADNLQGVVDKLMRQLAIAKDNQQKMDSLEPNIEHENTDLEQKLVADKRGSEPSPLPNEYRDQMISRILTMCSTETYKNVTDFEWYVEILVQLVRQLPASSEGPSINSEQSESTLGSRIGAQLLDIAVRVQELRPESVRAAEKLLLIQNRNTLYPHDSAVLDDVLRSVSWICGEFAVHTTAPYDCIAALVHEDSHNFSSVTTAMVVQALPKLFARIVAQANQEWNLSRQTMLELTLGRITTFLEALSTHPSLDVQERSVEFLELLRLGTEALKSQDSGSQSAPLLLGHALPSLFQEQELKPVSAAAQRKVPSPDDLDLDTAINPNLERILNASQIEDTENGHSEDVLDFTAFYFEREPSKALMAQSTSYSSYVDPVDDEPQSYQQPISPRSAARKRADRAARNRDDPFYIPSGSHTPSNEMSNIIQQHEGDLDIDDIPIVDLEIDKTQLENRGTIVEPKKTKKKPKKRAAVIADENIDFVDESTPGAPKNSHLVPIGGSANGSSSHTPIMKSNRNLLSIDSSNLGSFSLSEDQNGLPSNADIERRLAEDAEMAAALKEIERKRLELAREEEQARTAVAAGVDEDGAVIKRKKKKKTTNADDSKPKGKETDDTVVKKKKKKKLAKEDTANETDTHLQSTPLP